MSDSELLLLALRARENAYAPYSDFAVGAALLAQSDKVYLGCNVESATHTPTCCAERVAFFKALSEGEHAFSAIAVVGARRESNPSDLCPPCGVCRQVMREFCADDFRIILGAPDAPRVFTLDEILPLSFSGKNIQ